MEKKYLVFIQAASNKEGMITQQGRNCCAEKNTLLKLILPELGPKTAVVYNSLQLYSHDTARLSLSGIPNISYIECPNSDLSTLTPYDYQKSMQLVEKIINDNPLVDNLIIVSTNPFITEMPNMFTKKYLDATYAYGPINETDVLLLSLTQSDPIKLFKPALETITS